jgi:hypothetical protein
MRGRSRSLAKQQYWQDLCEQHRQSGQSPRVFCTAANIKLSAFYRWRRKLARAEAAGAPPTPSEIPRRNSAMKSRAAHPTSRRFVPVRVLPARDTQHERRGLEIVLAGGGAPAQRVVVRLEPGFDVPTLGEVLDVLEARSC